jgi:EpsI family protein
MTALAPTEQNTGLMSRRALVLGAGSAATATVAALMTPRRHAPGLDRMRLEDIVPEAVGPWQAQTSGAFILPEDTATASAYDQILTRRFAAATGPDIMLLIAHGAAQSGLMRVHRPEVCYASAGFQVRDLHNLDVRVSAATTIPAQAFTGVRDDRVESVLYWTRIAGFFPRSLTAQRLVMLRLGLQGLVPDGLLVRISALGVDAAPSSLMQFAGQWVRQANPEARAVVLGPQDSRSPT